MGSLGGLYIGISGLNVSQAALNVTAHNLANVDTKGFVRQQAVITDFKYIKWGESHISSMQQGLGTDFAALKQIRDSFLDKAYRQEIGRQAFYESQYQAVGEVEGFFGELEGVSFQGTINEFWVSLQELAKEPDSVVNRESFVETAVTFIERAENISSQLRDYQINLNTQITSQVNRINEIGEEINTLNIKIRNYEINSVEKANDLRDQRNLLLDELGRMTDISYKENSAGMVTVLVEGVSFVTEDTVFHMETAYLNENSGMLKPVWPMHGYADVYNLDRIPSSQDNTDIGSLKGLLFARGNKQANYLDQSLNADEYNKKIQPSVIMTIQAQFDKLIHGIVTAVNDVLCPNRKVTLADGSEVYILDTDKAPVGTDAGQTAGEALFNRKSMDRYSEPTDITLSDGSIVTGARIYNEENIADNYSLFTLGEIEVNSRILQNNSLLPLSSSARTGDYDIEAAKQLMSIWQQPYAELSPNYLTKHSFNEYYNAFISDIANRGEQLKVISENQEAMVESIDIQRLEITGVSSDEELTNLIKFQHAYNASARYINVVSEMLEHIIMNM